MDDGEADQADALSRLEAALDRIAAATPRHATGAGPAAGVDTAAVATRLDALIGDLHRALAGEG